MLVEKHDAASVHPRASRYNARSMEVFRALGVESDVRAAGVDLEKGVGSLSGPTLWKAIEGRPANNSRPDRQRATPEAELTPAPTLRAAQNRVEPILRAAAEARGGDLRFAAEA